MIGPAQLALDHGIKPLALVKAIAAALRYDHAEDPASHNLQSMIAAKGLPYAIRHICEISPEGELGKMIIEAYEDMGGWLDADAPGAKA